MDSNRQIGKLRDMPAMPDSIQFNLLLLMRVMAWQGFVLTCLDFVIGRNDLDHFDLGPVLDILLLLAVAGAEDLQDEPDGLIEIGSGLYRDTRIQILIEGGAETFDQELEYILSVLDPEVGIELGEALPDFRFPLANTFLPVISGSPIFKCSSGGAACRIHEFEISGMEFIK